MRKTRVGPFGSTDLHEQLQAQRIDTLVLAGISTSGVVLSTVREAHDRDCRLIVLADLCADRDAEVHEVLTGKVFPGQAEVIDSSGTSPAAPLSCGAAARPVVLRFCN